MGEGGIRHHLECKGGDLGTRYSPEERHALGQSFGQISCPIHFWC